MEIKSRVEIVPSYANDVVAYIIFGGIIVFISYVFFKTHKVDLIMPAIGVLMMLIVTCVYIRAQKIILGENFISHRSLGFFRLISKSFPYEEIDFLKMDGMALVIVRKGGKAPKLPANTFWGDYSKVMLIPASGFGRRIYPVIERLKAEGVPDRTDEK